MRVAMSVIRLPSAAPAKGSAIRSTTNTATILGTNLDDPDDPLLAGLSQSGNSFVGDTLFLGDELNKEFLALFGADLPKTQAEEAAIEAFFDGLAYRITVLVHQDVSAQDLVKGGLRKNLSTDDGGSALANQLNGPRH